MKRREFLQSAAIVPACIAGSHWSVFAESTVAAAKLSRISAVVYDERYADCRTFADTLARRGAVALPSGGDAVRVWYGALRKRLTHDPGLVAGFTTDSDLTVSRECGRELGLRLVYEGSHDSRASNRLTHRLRGTGAEKEVYAALLRDDIAWPEAIANALACQPLAARLANVIAGAPVIATSHFATHPAYITSWLLEAKPPQLV